MNEPKNQIEVMQTVDDTAYWLDKKNLNEMLAHFTEDALLKVYENGQVRTSLSGKAAIREMLISRLESIDMMFHNNGTHRVEVLSLDQKAVSYTSSIVKMKSADPAVTTDEDLYYEDKLVKVEGYWYIVDREVHIVSKSVR